MTRLNVSLKEDIVKQLEEEAEKNGKTVSSIVAEASNLYFRIVKEKLRPEDITKSYVIQEILREMNAVPVPEILLNSMIKSSLRNGKEEILKKWYERGVVLGNIMKKYSKNLAELAQLVKEYIQILPVDLFEIEFNYKVAKIVVSGVGYSLDDAQCTSEGMRGFLESYGYSVENTEISEGFVKVIAKEETKNSLDIQS